MSSAPSERRDVVLNVRGGGRLCVPEDLGQTTPYVLLEQEDWFEHEIRFVRRWLKPGMRVVDVGANYGVYTLAAARAVGREGRVWAFEPTPASAGYLERSLGMNEGIPAKLLRLAVSDHAGEVPFLLKGSPEENAVATAGAPGAIGVPAARLDDLAAEWGEVDFLKLDVEGHELQAIRGGERFLSERSPLVMLEIRSGKDFDLGAPGRLQALGYSMYRLLPGPQILVPFGADEQFDSSLLNIFACKDDRADKVSAAGFLARDPGAAFKASPQRWIDYAAATPYARTLGAGWRAKAGFLASPADKAYFEGLAAFTFSRDPAQSADARAASLLHAFGCVERALEADVSLSKQLSYARLAWEIGRRDPALDTLCLATLRLEGEARQAMEEPFLAPCARYDAVPAAERPEDWLRCAIVEQVEKLRAFSSLFVRQTVHEILRPIIGLPYRSPEMDRRWQLARMADGLPRERVDALCARSEENLNPEYWCRP